MDKIAYCLLYISLIILRWNAISYIYQLFVFSSLVNYLFLSFLGCLAFFFYGFVGFFCIFWIEKGKTSGARFPASEPCPYHLLTVTFTESPYFSAPQWPHLLHEVNNKPYLLGWLWGLNDPAHAKCLAQDLVEGRCLVIIVILWLTWLGGLGLQCKSQAEECSPT